MHGYVFTMQYPCGWVSPFGHCRIKACCQLPDTFRRLPRPSSPLTAKASTVCAYSLDHITPSRLGPICRTRMVTTYHFNKAASLQLALASRHVMDIRLKTLATSRLSKNAAPASAPGGFRSSCAHQTFRDSGSGGSGRTRTTGLTLIRGAL